MPGDETHFIEVFDRQYRDIGIISANHEGNVLELGPRYIRCAVRIRDRIFKRAYLLISAINDTIGLGNKAYLQQKGGLEPARVAVHFDARNSRVLLAEEREKPDETNRNNSKL